MVVINQPRRGGDVGAIKVQQGSRLGGPAGGGSLVIRCHAMATRIQGRPAPITALNDKVKRPIGPPGGINGDHGGQTAGPGSLVHAAEHRAGTGGAPGCGDRARGIGGEGVVAGGLWNGWG